MEQRSRLSLTLLVVGAVAAACEGTGPPTSPTPSPEPVPAPLYALSGRVQTAARQGIADATVTIVGRSVTTDANGHYAFSLGPGTYPVEVSKSGFEPRTVTHAVFRDSTFDIELRQAFRIDAGDTRTLTFDSSDDQIDFAVSYSECRAPCKPVHIVGQASGTLSLIVTAHDPNARLSVLTEGGWTEYCCESPIRMTERWSPSRDLRLYVSLGGRPYTDPRVTIATTFDRQ